ncbi:hypothetical protein [Peribacillus frigoritolerans]|uniref:hypothetical protein n=1 Tax=Peribacillus frigoritolerans TaxID=450367 RepID=UPI0039A371AE
MQGPTERTESSSLGNYQKIANDRIRDDQERGTGSNERTQRHPSLADLEGNVDKAVDNMEAIIFAA